MHRSYHISNRFLGTLALAVIVGTAIIELGSEDGVFITWGYILGILLTLPLYRKFYTIATGILACFLIIVSSTHHYGQMGSGLFLFNCLYTLAGVVLTTGCVIWIVSNKIKERNTIAQMESIFIHGTQGIIVFDAEGQVLLANPFAEKMFGYSQGDLEGRSINFLVPQITYGTDKDVTGEINSQTDLSVLRKNGARFSIDLSLNKYEHAGKQHNLAFLIDITQRKESEEHLRISKEDLEKSNQELEAFSYSVSHDLRAPLRAVASYAQMLEEDCGHLLDAEGIRLLNIILKSASKMGMLIDDLLAFSRLGRTNHRMVRIEMTDFVNNTLGEINQTIPHKAEIVNYPLHSVVADTALMNQVVMNLISNAIKYSSKNERPYIEIRSKEENGEVVFSVRDNGVGFEMEYVHKLFGVFQRLHTNEEFEGTGVGLAIAKRIIDKHGGRMWAEGEPDKGACFYFSLPMDSKNL